MPTPRRLLIVRLRNWVGDVTLGVPLLQRLGDEGFDLQLVGKGWARDLLAGHGWPVHALPKSWQERVALLRQLKSQAAGAGPGRGLNALCLPYSFSSALEFRLAGLRALGYAYEGRSLLLARAVPRPQGVHELQVYWALGDALLGHVAPPPKRIGLRVSAEHRAQAQALRAAHGIEAGCIVICPFAGGTWSKQDKTWPGFANFVAQVLPGFGRSVVVCPGPGEEAIARDRYASARLLPGMGLGAYAALLQDAALMISNDTGPGHIAAAVGTPLVSVLGPSDPALWRAWGPSVQVLQGAGTWPEAEAVRAAVALALQGR
ncbi:MAG: glycosyltransferase family 9 protein [Betaproteobacteria bacterium]|nr:glycosyltransferase family 9 protein [Betaproteobacteria bacterium]